MFVQVCCRYQVSIPTRALLSLGSQMGMGCSFCRPRRQGNHLGRRGANICLRFLCPNTFIHFLRLAAPDVAMSLSLLSISPKLPPSLSFPFLLSFIIFVGGGGSSQNEPGEQEPVSKPQASRSWRSTPSCSCKCLLYLLTQINAVPIITTFRESPLRIHDFLVVGMQYTLCLLSGSGEAEASRVGSSLLRFLAPGQRSPPNETFQLAISGGEIRPPAADANSRPCQSCKEEQAEHCELHCRDDGASPQCQGAQGERLSGTYTRLCA